MKKRRRNHKTRRYLSLKDIKFQPRYKSGVCRYCGCTDNDPCYNPNYGNCWWVDKEHTICSHCADELIVNDEGTIHCIVRSFQFNNFKFLMLKSFVFFITYLFIINDSI